MKSTTVAVSCKDDECGTTNWVPVDYMPGYPATMVDPAGGMEIYPEFNKCTYCNAKLPDIEEAQVENAVADGLESHQCHLADIARDERSQTKGESFET